jgi:predicted Zn-dependent peptidase
MDGLVDLDVHGLPEDSLDTYRTRVRAVAARDAARAALDHLHPERAAIVLVGPAEQIEPQLADLGPVRIVEP